MSTLTPSRVRLTEMERRVVRLISLGCSVKQAAAVLYRSAHTVDNHKTRAMKKLGVHNSAGLTRRALELGVSHLEDRLTPEEHLRIAGRANVIETSASRSIPIASCLAQPPG